MEALRPGTTMLPMALISAGGLALYVLSRWDIRRKRRARGVERLQARQPSPS